MQLVEWLSIGCVYIDVGSVFVVLFFFPSNIFYGSDEWQFLKAILIVLCALFVVSFAVFHLQCC